MRMSLRETFMRRFIAAAVIVLLPAPVMAQSAELERAKVAVEKILADPAKQQAYCDAMKLESQVTEENERIAALGDKATAEELEKSATQTKDWNEQADKLWHEIDVDYTEISRATSFAALLDPQSNQPYPGAEKFIEDQQQMNARCID
jgi:hypothetical protein